MSSHIYNSPKSEDSSVSCRSVESKQATTIVYQHSNTPSSATSISSVQQNIESRIQVVCRVRPFSLCELKTVQGRTCGLVIDDASISVETQHGSQTKHRSYTFDTVLPSNATQQKVFQVVGSPIVEHCYEGFNATIFAYGQTGSGKSYTIFGTSTNDIFKINEQSGIGPRVLHDMYNKLQQQKEFISWKCSCMMIQIYNEMVTDLLNPTGKKLSISLVKGVPVVEGVSMHAAPTLLDALSLLVGGHKEREVGQTMMNQKSSRSHMVFTLVLETESYEEGCVRSRRSRLNIVDLAGSERFDAAQSQGVHFQELKYINKSLSALNHVIKQLSDKHTKSYHQNTTHKSSTKKASPHIDYRSSKLTFLLKDCLGGSSLCSILVCVSPSKVHSSETWSTLEFAKRAKNIRLKPIRHQVTCLCEEEQDLRKSIQAFNDYVQDKTKDTKSISRACTRLSQTFGSGGLKQEALDDALRQAEEARVERDHLRNEVKQLNKQVANLVAGVSAGKIAMQEVQILLQKANQMEQKYESCQSRFEQYTTDVAKMMKSMMGKIDQLQAEERRQKFEQLTEFWDQRALHSEWLAAQQENTKLIKQIQALNSQVQLQKLQSKLVKKHLRHFSEETLQKPLTSAVGHKGKVSLMPSINSTLSRFSSKPITSPIKSEDIFFDRFSSRPTSQKSAEDIFFDKFSSRATTSPKKSEDMLFSSPPAMKTSSFHPNNEKFSLEQAFERFNIFSIDHQNFKSPQKTNTVIDRLGEFSDAESAAGEEQEEESRSTQVAQILEVPKQKHLRQVGQTINELKRSKRLRRSMSSGQGELMSFLQLQKQKYENNI